VEANIKGIYEVEEEFKEEVH